MRADVSRGSDGATLLRATLSLLLVAGVASLSIRLLGVKTTSSSSSAALSPNFVQRLLLKAGGGKRLREKVVERYFDGVNKKDRDQIVSCFDPSGATIRDVCGVTNVEREANPEGLADRCMEFLAAHPDTKVEFHYGPMCGRGRSRWVVAHWFETGTWSGVSCGVEPYGTPLDVEGQTRFLVSDDLKITKFVVTRTFSEWENSFQQK